MKIVEPLIFKVKRMHIKIKKRKIDVLNGKKSFLPYIVNY